MSRTSSSSAAAANKKRLSLPPSSCRFVCAKTAIAAALSLSMHGASWLRRLAACLRWNGVNVDKVLFRTSAVFLALALGCFFVFKRDADLKSNVIFHILPNSAELERLKRESTVHIAAGSVVGKVYATHRAFYGIPFAEAPVGERRWTAPTPIVRFAGSEGRFYATAMGNSCVQHLNGPSFARRFLVGDGEKECENCLTLNVYTPRSPPPDDEPAAERGTENKNAPPPLLPVLIFVYGGKFASGSNSQDAYNPLNLFKRSEKFVLVAPNYRVGPLGFLASKELLQFARDHGLDEAAVGNYGIYDIVAAVEWTRANIAAFGGDPDAISLQGQSAGAMSCTFVYKALLAKKHFWLKGLVLNSLSDPRYIMRRIDDSITQATFDAIAHDAGCWPLRNGSNDEYVACMRRIPIATLQRIVVERHLDCVWSPFEDGRVFRHDTIKDYATDVPAEARARVLITVMRDDATMFLYKARTATYEEAVRSLSFLYHDYAVSSRIISHYKPHHFRNRFHAMAQAVTDHTFRCPSVDLHAVFSAAGHRVFYMELDFQLSLLSMLTKWAVKNELGAFHGADVFYFFGSRNFLLTAKERVQAARYQKRILQFVICGTPILDGETADTFAPSPYWKKRCAFWQRTSFPFPRKSFANFHFTRSTDDVFDGEDAIDDHFQNYAA